MKIFVCAVLLITVCFVPAGSVPETPERPPGGGVTVSVQMKRGESPGTSEAIEYVVIPGQDICPVPDMVIIVEAGCDPDMLLPAETDCDAGLIIDRSVIYNVR